MSIHPPCPRTFPYSDISQYGWELSWNDESILSWSLVGRSILAPYQHVGNNGHSLRTDKALKIYSTFLCPDYTPDIRSVSRGIQFSCFRPFVCPTGPTFRVKGFNFVTTLCFIPLRYIINLSVKELIALKPLWEFTMGCSP